jgi:hypothetical protein
LSKSSSMCWDVVFSKKSSILFTKKLCMNFYTVFGKGYDVDIMNWAILENYHSIFKTWFICLEHFPSEDDAMSAWHHGHRAAPLNTYRAPNLFSTFDFASFFLSKIEVWARVIEAGLPLFFSLW